MDPGPFTPRSPKRSRGRTEEPMIIGASNPHVNDEEELLFIYDFPPTTCEFCRKMFMNEQTLIWHMPCSLAAQHQRLMEEGLNPKVDHETIRERLFECKHCLKRFKDIQGIRQHSQYHLPKRYQCIFEGCDALFQTRTNAIHHTRKHTDDVPKTPPQPKRPGNQASLSRKSGIPKRDDSKMLYIESRDSLECQDCKQVFPRQSLRMVHAPCLFDNQVPGKVKCHFLPCHMEHGKPLEFASIEDLQNHSVDHFDVTSNYYCAGCEGGFFREEDVKEHIKQVHQKIPEKRVLDLNTAVDKKTPAKTRNTPSNQRKTCDICFKEVCNKYYLEIHKKNVHPEP